MTAKQRALDLIHGLPADVDFTSMIRELAFLAGTEEAREEIRRGEVMNSAEAKQKLQEWLSK